MNEQSYISAVDELMRLRADAAEQSMTPVALVTGIVREYLTGDLVSRAVLEEAEGERDRLAAMFKNELNQIYPAVAGRAMLLRKAGEDNAAEVWESYARRIYEALGRIYKVLNLGRGVA